MLYVCANSVLVSSDGHVKNPFNTDLSTACAPCDQCDPNFLLTGHESEASISDDIGSVEEDTEKDPGSIRSHRAHRLQVTDNILTDDSFIPIVSENRRHN